MRRNAGIASVAAIVAAGIMAAPAPAATVTITGDAGAPVALAPGAPAPIRNMKFDLGIALAATERAYAVAVTGPAGANGVARTCSTTQTVPMPLDFQGNGAYTATVTTYTDTLCRAGARPQQYQWVVSASTAITPPARAVLTRKPGDFITRAYDVPVALNPGALSTTLYYARGGKAGPDGGILGTPREAFVDATTGKATVRFEKPGTYLLVARATGYTGAAGQFFTPFSAPVTVRALAPFDFVGTPLLPDARGPRYKISAQIREKSTRGKVKIQMARKGGKFFSIGSARIRRGGRISKSFTQHNTGKYRVRFIYKGSATTAGGRITGSVTFRRTFF
jgi:hypothetical protein